MHSDLEHLVSLQRIDLAIEDARRLIATVPERSAALDARIESARAAVATEKERKAATDPARRDIERDRSTVRARRSKYSDQTMAVKTNKEFHALQHEMQAADEEIAKYDDRDLELMMEADEIAAAIKAADSGLKEAERGVAADRQTLEAEAKEAAARIETLGRERVDATAQVSPSSLALYHQIAKPRRGIALAPLHGDLCSICHVHVRPHILQQVRRGEAVLQCESCHRILYYEQPPASPAAATGAASCSSSTPMGDRAETRDRRPTACAWKRPTASS
jgi:predicted  nucleic acid-binding Zn-ribbon protein